MNEGRTLFEEVVLEQCGAALASYGFQVALSRPDLVRFVSSVTFVDVYYHVRYIEVGVDIGLGEPEPESPPVNDSGTYVIGRRAPPNTVSLDDVIEYSGVDARSDSLRGSFMFYNLETLLWGIPRLVNALNQCAGAVLRGDRAAFAAVGAYSSRAAQEDMARRRQQDLRSAAGRAWMVKDYAAVVRALEPLDDARTPAEEAKLAYARQHQAGI